MVFEFSGKNHKYTYVFGILLIWKYTPGAALLMGCGSCSIFSVGWLPRIATNPLLAGEKDPPPSQCPPLPVNCVIFHFIKNNFACYLNLFLVYAILVHKGNTLKIQEYSYYVSVPLIISQHAKPNHLA